MSGRRRPPPEAAPTVGSVVRTGSDGYPVAESYDLVRELLASAHVDGSIVVELAILALGRPRRALFYVREIEHVREDP